MQINPRMSQSEYVITVQSITGLIHDQGSAPGCLPYKIVVQVSLPVKEFNRLCPINGPARSTLCGRQPARRDLGSLVVLVNNMVYGFNKNIPAYSPSIDSQGSKRAKNGIKTIEFVYFLSKSQWQQAEALGFEHFKFEGHDPIVKGYQFIPLYKAA